MSVKQYFKSIQLEQSQARVSPKQATPIFFDKFKKIIYLLRVLLLSKDVLPSERYIYARDLAFFSLDFFSGDRALDLGRIKTIDVLRHPDGMSLLFHQHIGKTLRGKHSRAFAVKQTANPAICPVQNLQFYINLCASMQVKLSSGFLFHPTTSKGCISNAPFLASTMQARLVKYLSTLGIYDGESVHGFRGGTSILLRLSGVSKEEVAKDVGWQSTSLVDCYTQVEKVMSASTSSDILARSTVDHGQGSQVEELGKTFRECNH